MTSDREHGLRSVLGDKFDLLAEMGFAVVDAADLDRYRRESAEEVERARRIAKAALDAAEMRGVMVTIARDRNGRPCVIVCDPQGDEEVMAHRVVAALGAFAVESGEKTGVPPRAFGEREAE